MPEMTYVLLQRGDGSLLFVEMPATHAYQLSALNLRLHKELSKLTADNIPQLPRAIAEIGRLELFEGVDAEVKSGMTYINELEASFAAVRESAYPLVSLLTEIRALQAQLEQWYEEEGLL